MPSVLGTNLLDSLVPLVDQVRGTIHTAVGDRQWTVTVVKRTWSGGVRGKGTPTTVETLLTPTPAVDFSKVDYTLQQGGHTEDGMVTISEISLAYSEDQLTPKNIGPATDFYYRITDAQGQGLGPRLVIPDGPAVPDRERTFGWIVRCRVNRGPE